MKPLSGAGLDGSLTESVSMEALHCIGREHGMKFLSSVCTSTGVGNDLGGTTHDENQFSTGLWRT